MTWWMYGILTALIWGIHYNLLSRALIVASPITLYWMPTTIMVLGLPWLYPTLKSDIIAALVAPPLVRFAVFFTMFTSFAGSYCLFRAIQLHNPVHVGLLEVTYPVFTCIFGYLLFHENHFDWSTILGGTLILIGTGVIIYSNG